MKLKAKDALVYVVATALFIVVLMVFLLSGLSPDNQGVVTDKTEDYTVVVDMGDRIIEVDDTMPTVTEVGDYVVVERSSSGDYWVIVEVLP